MFTIFLALMRTISHFLFAETGKRSVFLEFWALHHQVLLLKRNVKRPVIRHTDRLFWVSLRNLYGRWRKLLHFVQPETVIRWQKSRFRRYWWCISKPKGRPPITKDIRDLVRIMSTENKTWGVPRLRGELLKLGIRLAVSTIQRIIRPRVNLHPTASVGALLSRTTLIRSGLQTSLP